jgi:mRNA interferase RelE/StbE
VFEVLLERGASKELSAAPSEDRNRIIERLKSLASDPRSPAVKKLSGYEELWRFRVGDWRVVFEIDDEAHEVRVLRIRRRREVYRNL